MKSTSQRQPIRKSLAISVCLNGFMVAVGTLARLFRPLSWLAIISDSISAPPAFLIGWLVRPRSHEIAAYIFAAIAGLVISIFFYAAVAWIVLRLISRWRERHRFELEL